MVFYFLASFSRLLHVFPHFNAENIACKRTSRFSFEFKDYETNLEHSYEIRYLNDNLNEDIYECYNERKIFQKEEQ